MKFCINKITETSTVDSLSLLLYNKELPLNLFPGCTVNMLMYLCDVITTTSK